MDQLIDESGDPEMVKYNEVVKDTISYFLSKTPETEISSSSQRNITVWFQQNFVKTTASRRSAIPDGGTDAVKVIMDAIKTLAAIAYPRA